MEPRQQQWQGTERRQSQGSYIGEERRKAKPAFEEPQDPAGDGQASPQQMSKDANPI